MTSTRGRAAMPVLVAALAAVGALAASSSAAARAAQPRGLPSGHGTAPPASWYWTMAVSSADPNVLVLGTSNGLYRSADGGKTWHSTGPRGIEPTSVVQVGNAIFAGGAAVAPQASPVTTTASGRTARHGHPLLAASSDGGRTWRELHPLGLPNVSLQALAVDPGSSAVLYAVLTSGQLYRSTDAGRSFRLVSPKTEQTPWALAVTRGGHFIAGDMDTGSYLSANGKVWQHTDFADRSGSEMVMEYAVQPTDSSRVLLSSEGIEMSTDGGRTWQVALRSNVMFGPVAWAPGTSAVAYAVGFDGSVWRSDDSGERWTEVS